MARVDDPEGDRSEFSVGRASLQWRQRQFSGANLGSKSVVSTASVCRANFKVVYSTRIMAGLGSKKWRQVGDLHGDLLVCWDDG